MAENALILGLRTEFAAVYAYSLAGAQLSGERREAARANEAVHRDRRDAVMAHLTESKVKLPNEEAAYTLPGEAGDAESAAALLGQIEAETTRLWRAVLAETVGADRRAAVAAYSSSAVTLARWKRAMGETPSTAAFPGRE